MFGQKRPAVQRCISSKGFEKQCFIPFMNKYAGGIAKKVEEATVIATLGIDVTIALAGSKAGRLACMLSPAQIRSHSDWEGTCVLTCK